MYKSPCLVIHVLISRAKERAHVPSIPPPHTTSLRKQHATTRHLVLQAQTISSQDQKLPVSQLLACLAVRPKENASPQKNKTTCDWCEKDKTNCTYRVRSNAKVRPGDPGESMPKRVQDPASLSDPAGSLNISQYRIGQAREMSGTQPSVSKRWGIKLC